MTDIVVFDGVCNLCAHSVQFILRHEADARLHFAAVQSPAGTKLLGDHGFPAEDVKTFVLVADGKAYTRSDAAIRVSAYLRGGWKLLGLVRVIPRPIRDWMYDRVARNRYRWFGKTEACMIPTPELRSRFLHD